MAESIQRSSVLASDSEEEYEQLLPYQFEPEPSECNSDSGHEIESLTLDTLDRQDRTKSDDWCQCGNCQQKQQEIECICCMELQDTKSILDKHNLSM